MTCIVSSRRSRDLLEEDVIRIGKLQTYLTSSSQIQARPASLTTDQQHPGGIDIRARKLGNNVFTVRAAHFSSVRAVLDAVVVEKDADEVEIRDEFGKDNNLDTIFFEIFIE